MDKYGIMNNPTNFETMVQGLATICFDIGDYEILDRVRFCCATKDNIMCTSFKIKHKESLLVKIISVLDHDYKYLTKIKRKTNIGFFVYCAETLKNNGFNK